MAVALFCLRDYFEGGNMTSQSEIKIALCNRGFKEIDQLFQFAYDNNFQGVEYTIEAESYTDFDRTYDRLLKLKESEEETKFVKGCFCEITRMKHPLAISHYLCLLVCRCHKSIQYA